MSAKTCCHGNPWERSHLHGGDLAYKGCCGHQRGHKDDTYRHFENESRRKDSSPAQPISDIDRTE